MTIGEITYNADHAPLTTTEEMIATATTITEDRIEAMMAIGPAFAHLHLTEATEYDQTTMMAGEVARQWDVGIVTGVLNSEEGLMMIVRYQEDDLKLSLMFRSFRKIHQRGEQT
jgi:hypothetical protein